MVGLGYAQLQMALKLTAGVRKRSSLGGQSWNFQAEAEVAGEI